MAYLHDDKPDENGAKTANESAGSGLLGGYSPLSAGFAPSLVQPIYGGGGSGPSVTGHVNFDRIYAANEGTAHRDATNMGLAAQNAAGAARNRLGAMQSQFSSQSKAAAGSGPTAAQREWASSASTGVQPGKKVVSAYVAPSAKGASPPDPHQKPETTQVDDRDRVARGLDDSDGKHWDSVAQYDAAHPVNDAPSGGAVVGPEQSHVTEQQQGSYDSGGVVRDANGNVVSVIDVPDQAANAANEAAVRAGAAGAYTGPESLEGMDGYQGLLGDYAKAQRSLSGLTDDAHIQGSLDEQNKGPFIEGGNKLDAALIGQAGRPEFAKLGEQYKGLGGEVGAANKASLSEAEANKAAAASHAAEYQGLLGGYTGRQDADQAVEDKSQAASNQKVADAYQHADNQRAYDTAQQQAHSGINVVRNTLHGAANLLNPIDDIVHATGNVSPTDAGTNFYGTQYAGDRANQFNAGNASSVWGPNDADVFASMTPEDWAKFNSMGADAQKAFIKARHRKGK